MANQLAPSKVLAELEGLDAEIPRYLYRVHAPDSNGHNSTTSFASAAAHNGILHEELSDIPYNTAKRMLIRHFIWRYYADDEFISWTSSLLYALQYAVRKTRNIKYSNVVSAESDIKLCVLDTLTLDTFPFYPALDLMRIYNIPEGADGSTLRHAYSENEYLYHGELSVKGISSTVSLATLRKEGLFDLLPWLDDEVSKFRLWLRVHDQRWRLFAAQTPASAREGSSALRLALLFRGAFTLPMLVALLSLRNRSPTDQMFLTIFRNVANLLKDESPKSSPSYGDSYHDFPELETFARMMDAGLAEVGYTEEMSPDAVDELGIQIAAFGL